MDDETCPGAKRSTSPSRPTRQTTCPRDPRARRSGRRLGSRPRRCGQHPVACSIGSKQRSGRSTSWSTTPRYCQPGHVPPAERLGPDAGPWTPSRCRPSPPRATIDTRGQKPGDGPRDGRSSPVARSSGVRAGAGSSTSAPMARMPSPARCPTARASKRWRRTAARPRASLASTAITVNIVSLGPIRPAGSLPDLEATIVRDTPLGRVGSPDDVADVIVFLASEQARWLTGQRICRRRRPRNVKREALPV